MKHNYISIGLPVYNAELYLEYAIKSVLAQTHAFWELIIIDDGSTDNSLKIAKDYEKNDKRIRVISDGNNKKLPARLNQLIDESQYDYIARMDADDLMHPKRLEFQLAFLLQNKECDLVSTGIALINQNNIVYNYRKLDELYTQFDDARISYPIVHPSVFARKEWYLRNKYDVNFPRAEDFELWSRAIDYDDFKMAILPEIFLYYREYGNITADKMIDSYNDGLRVYNKYNKGINIRKRTQILLKKSIVRFLDKTDQLQLLAKARNRNGIDNKLINYHQQIVNDIINFSCE